MSDGVARRLMVVNLFFSPQSYGGATIIAEQMSVRLKRDYGWNILVVTLIHDNNMPEYQVLRYRTLGLDVVGIVVHEIRHDFINGVGRINSIILSIANSFVPDVCHVHAIQGIAGDWVKLLKKAGVRLVSTVHDCWWICERQFMIDFDGYYCGQEKIDSSRCNHCMMRPFESQDRSFHVSELASFFDLFLFPSQSHKILHENNGFRSQICFVNRNGVSVPGPDYVRNQGSIKRKSPVVFGFTGGPGKIKGSQLIIDSFSSIPESLYHIKFVDAAGNRGDSWRNHPDWQLCMSSKSLSISLVAAYTQETIDNFFSGIDVLLFPSAWKESFGLTVREALLRDVWVIATDCGAAVEDIVDGENGTLLPFNCSISSMKEAVMSTFDRDWSTYVNPYKSRIVDFDRQAEELNSYICGLV